MKGKAITPYFNNSAISYNNENANLGIQRPIHKMLFGVE